MSPKCSLSLPLLPSVALLRHALGASHPQNSLGWKPCLWKHEIMWWGSHVHCSPALIWIDKRELLNKYLTAIAISTI